MRPDIGSTRERGTAFGLFGSTLTLVLSLSTSYAMAQQAGSSVLFSEDFDHPPPYDAILDPTDPGGWEVSVDPFPGWPAHNGLGNYARAHDLCGGAGDRLLRLPAAGTLIDLTLCNAATLTLWAAHGTCSPGCPPLVDTCRLALRTFVTPSGPFTEVLLLNFPDPLLSGCGGPGVFAADLSYDLAPYLGLYVQVVVRHATGTIDHLLIDDVLVTADCGPGTAICFGDGSGTPCPCGNNGGAGTGGGCTNGGQMPAGQGAILSASGSNGILNDDLILTADFVTNQPGLFFQGDVAIAGGNGIAFGDGLRCCGQNVLRLEIADPAGANGPHTTSTTQAIFCTSPPGTTGPGDKTCYQYWYRNPNRSLCGFNFNLSNAVSVTWTVGTATSGGCGAPADIANVSFGQLNWFSAEGLSLAPESAWGVMRMEVIPDVDQFHYLNVVADAGSGGTWIIQNYPLFPALLPGDPAQQVDFDISEFGVVGDLPAMHVWYSIDPQPQAFPSQDVDLGVVHVDNLDATYPACDCTCQPITFLQDAGKPGGHKAQAAVQDVIQHKNVPGVQEAANRCMAGAFARSIKWLDNEYTLGSGKTVEQMYQDLLNAGVKGPGGIPYEQQVQAKDDYLEGIKAGSTTKVLDLAGSVPPIPGGNVPETTGGDLVDWLKQELPTEDVELSYFTDETGGKRHIVTITGYYSQGGKHFVKYRDDQNQGSNQGALAGDKEEKTAELKKSGGDYFFRKTDTATGWKVSHAFSESVPQ